MPSDKSFCNNCNESTFSKIYQWSLVGDERTYSLLVSGKRQR